MQNTKAPLFADGDILASDKEKPPSGGGAYTEYVSIHDGGFDAVSRKIAPSALQVGAAGVL